MAGRAFTSRRQVKDQAVSRCWRVDTSQGTNALRRTISAITIGGFKTRALENNGFARPVRIKPFVAKVRP